VTFAFKENHIPNFVLSTTLFSIRRTEIIEKLQKKRRKVLTK